MNILITGAAGFIGTHLVNYLHEKTKHTFVGLDVEPMDFQLRVLADIADDKRMGEVAELLKTTVPKIDAVIHLAAVASPPIAQKNPAKAWSVNVHGTQNVLKLMHEIGCRRIVFFSSAHVYGISPRYMPTDEQHPLALHDTYTTTKILGEELCRLYYENHGISCGVLRLWNAYGPGQNADYFLGKKIAQAKAGALTIRNENVTKDWIHVSDVVRAAEMAARSNYVGPLNVGTGVETSLRQIVDALSLKFGVSVQREEVPDEGPTHMRCDFSRIKTTLGWEPSVDFMDGLADLMKRS